MAPAFDPTRPDDEELCAVLHGYLEALDTGPAPDRADLLARHPDFAVELAEFFAYLDRLDATAAAMRLTGVADPTVIQRQAPPPGPARVAVNSVLGDYELRAQLARGGMGVVWRAWQRSAAREVALKLLPAGTRPDDPDAVRFRTEAATAANFDHPNIVPIYEVGEWRLDDGTAVSFFSMKLLEDGPLSGHKQRFRGAWRSAARLVATAARAVHHAHQRGVLHRDLKPANILLAGDTPYLADFGIARRLSSDGPTVTGAVLGTPAYMAPEQAAGQTRQLTTAADVYGLGAVLYELLTDRPPFRDATPVQTLHRVLTEEPVAPRKLDRTVPADLQVICLKCLQKQPTQRYASAEELADDLERWLAGGSIRARPARPWERAWKWARRNPAVAGLTAAVVVAVAIGLMAAAWQYRRTMVALAAEEASNYANRVHLAASYVEKGQPDRADEQLDACSAERRGWEWRFLRRACRPPVVTLRGHTGPVLAVRYSLNGRQVATGSRDGTARLWDAATGLELAVLRAHTASVKSVSFRADDRVLATGGEDETVIVWDAETRTERRRLTAAGGLAAFAPAGPRLAVGARDGRVTVWDGDTGQQVWSARPYDQPVSGLAFSPDGSRLATTSVFSDHAVVFDAANGGEAIRKPLLDSLGFSAEERRLTRPVFTSDGTRLLFGGSTLIWECDARTGAFLRYIVGCPHRQCGLAISRDGQRLATSSNFGPIRQFDLATGLSCSAPRDQRRSVPDLDYSPDSQTLAVPRDATVTLEPARGPRTAASRTFPGRWPDMQWHRPLAFSPDGRQLACVNIDRRGKRLCVLGWDLASGRELHAHEYDCDYWDNSQVLFGPDGRGLYVRCVQPQARVTTVTIHDLADGRDIWSFPSPLINGDHAEPVALSPDGTRLARVGADGTIELRDARTSNVVWSSPVATENWTSMHFSPDGRRLALAGQMSRTAVVLDADSGRVVASIPDQAGRLNSVRFSPDGRRLAVADEQGARILDIATARCQHELSGHQNRVQHAEFSPDGRRVVSVGMDGVVKLWDADSGQELLTITDPTVRLQGAVFSPDGQLLAVACTDGSVRLYDGSPLPDAVEHPGEPASTPDL